MSSKLIWFSYLKHLNIPQKYKISHGIVNRLIQIDIETVEDSTNLSFDDIIDHGILSKDQQNLENILKKLSTSEASFQIAQNEYEKKEERFIELTSYSTQSLDQIYAEKTLVLRDIKEENLLLAMEGKNITTIISTIDEIKGIVSKDIDVFYQRLNFLVKLWNLITDDLLVKIKSFEFRGLKVVSSNLRIKLLPQIALMKQELSKPSLMEDSLSRSNIENQINEMVEQAREDIYGDLNGDQIELLNDINSELSTAELVRIINDEKVRKNLIVLLETEKINISMRKVIDRLI